MTTSLLCFPGTVTFMRPSTPNGHLSPAQREKMQKACRESVAGPLYDPATSAPFGHLNQLALGRGSHFDPAKRGLALAIAGRSAEADTYSADSVANATSRHALLLEARVPQRVSRDEGLFSRRP